VDWIPLTTFMVWSLTRTISKCLLNFGILVRTCNTLHGMDIVSLTISRQWLQRCDDLWRSRMWWHVIWWTFTIISEKWTASIFRVKEKVEQAANSKTHINFYCGICLSATWVCRWMMRQPLNYLYTNIYWLYTDELQFSDCSSLGSLCDDCSWSLQYPPEQSL
jgi:hypothetical protein